ncbi:MULTISPECIES: hypothetical protein [unclassified Hydrogenobaculum]|uniref:hypothetical protein n=1 Tax=unclassified Hydrogenobaculum TaxID=2622382 RepID=UPI0001C50D99|nr:MULTISPECIES: hypothetical protein [unclassified Hydrogenobaculum]AEF18822.1 hypothetical protein Hyd3684_0419 [Hydrogenobaculum sp. 3684]AEG46110.1 hypothetical protein HydSHO_0419 [Hydrogenobaculum sp. SHO]AGG14754.1 hypothetical protein HydHO_0421 [Hydrogenobaculum sp. HO]AGH93052.1 hypothetical protein HydSN_0431 [Hydrogenobaculum sp. SN]
MLNVLGALDSLIGVNSIPLPPPTPADSTNSAYGDFSNLLDSFSQKPKNDSNIPKDINKLFQDILTLFQNISSLMSNAITNIHQESSKDNIKINISKIDSIAKSHIVNVLKDVENLLKDTTKDNHVLSTIDDIIKDIQNPSKNQDFVLSISIKEEYVSTTTNDFLGSTLSNLDKYILSNKDISSYISSFSFSVVLEQDDTSIPIFSIKAQKPESKDENANNIPSSKISNQDPAPTEDLGNNADTTPKEDDQAIKTNISNTDNLTSSQASNDTNIKRGLDFLTISARYISDTSNKNVFEYSFKGIKITIDTSYNKNIKIDKPLSTTKDDPNKKLSNNDIKPSIDLKSKDSAKDPSSIDNKILGNDDTTADNSITVYKPNETTKQAIPQDPSLKSDTPNIQVKSSDSQNIAQADVQAPKDKPIPPQNQDAIKTDTSDMKNTDTTNKALTNNVDSSIQDVKQHIQKHMNALNLDKTYKDVFDNSILNGKPIFETQNLKNPIEGLVKDISSLQAFKEENQKQDKKDQSDAQNFNMGQNLQANVQDKTNEIKADNLFKEIEKTVLKESKNPVLMKNVSIKLDDGTDLQIRFNANNLSITINTNTELVYKDSQIKDLLKNLQNLGFSVENITINGTTIESQMEFSQDKEQGKDDKEDYKKHSSEESDFEFINAI